MELLIARKENMIKRIICLIVCLVSVLSLDAQVVSRPDSSVLAHGNWYSITIPSTGLYKLTYSDFVALGVEESEINFDNLSIFGKGGEAISDTNAKYEYSDLRENAIYVNNQGGGYVLFFAEGTLCKTFDKQTQKYSFKMHPYSDVSTYFITFDAQIGEKKRISAREELSLEAVESLSSVREVFLHKRELVNFLSSGRNWAGEAMSVMSNELSIPIVLQNLKPNTDVNFEIGVFNQSETASGFEYRLNNSLLGSVTLAKTPTDYAASYSVNNFSFTPNSESPTLKITFNAQGTARGRLDYVKADYEKNLRYNNSLLMFKPTADYDTAVCVEYVISNVKASEVIVWEITPSGARKIEDYSRDGEQIRLKVVSNPLHTILISSGTNFPTPGLRGRVANQNLHSWQPTEFVIVAAPEFLSQAEELAELHRQYDNISVQVATTTQVYNEFSSGTKDILAIRELMRMLYDRYSPQGEGPKNLLLFGDGTFDNKNILKYNNNFIPTYQAENSLINAGSSFVTDDVLSYLSPYATGNIRDTMLIGVGRFTVNTTSEAQNMVDKCRRYISKEDLKQGQWGDWRNMVTLTADDADTWGERYFIENAENIYYEIKQTNPTLNVEKIYSDAYKQYSSSSGATYPDASKAINQRMKKGCLLFNYVGHGSDDHLSSERLITITDITSWNNKNALPIVITSTCEFTRFDQADKQSAGEFVLSSENGGGIALISASRKIPSRNEINRNLHRYAVIREEGRGLTFGEIFMRAKNATNMVVEERSFGLFGDPALRIDLPQKNVITTKINDKAISGTDIADTVSALSSVSLEGAITDQNGNVVETFNGKVQITLLDKATNYRTLDNEGLNTDIEFEQQKNILHKGVANVENGRFAYTFTMPKDIAYNYGKGKISYYAQSDSTDAAGNFTSFIVGGIDTTVEIRETRPEVRLYMNDTNFRSGGITDENPSLFAIVSDSIAINTVGTGLGHDIMARLDNAANTFVLNDYFETDYENPGKGTIRFPFTNLDEGEHTLTLKVWNIFNFSSEAEIKFVVCSSKRGEEFVLKNYPNPFSQSTNIVLEHNQSGTINSATLQIFNQNGKIIFEKDATALINSYTVGPIEWNPLSDSGERLGAGIYFARMLLTTSSDEIATKTIKMVVFSNNK